MWNAEEPGEFFEKNDKNMVTVLQKTLISPAQVMVTLPCPVSWFRAEESKIEQVLAERLDLTPGSLREGLRCAAVAFWGPVCLGVPREIFGREELSFFSWMRNLLEYL